MTKVLLNIYLLFAGVGVALAQTTLEAEDGTLTGTEVSTAVSGYSGSGYVTGFDASGDKVQVSFDAGTAGAYNLTIGFRAEYDPKQQDLHVNGTYVKTIEFPKSTTFTSLDAGSIDLVAGTNTISIVSNWGYSEVDYFTVTAGSSSGSSPVAAAGKDQVVIDIDGNGEETVNLNASGSSDPEGDIVSYTWYYSDATEAGSGEVLDIILAKGDHQLTLKVTDAEGNFDEDQLTIFVGSSDNNGNNRIPIRNGLQNIFASGINLAWDDFAQDIVALDKAYFEEVLDTISKSGGNAMRWWLHTNGISSPQFDAAGNVTGVNSETIANMRTVLDMAYERGIMISMCLWSFDMLQPQGQDQEMMKAFVESKEKTQTYIDNALIPILEEIGDHPAVLTWEIFNEAEGMTEQFGWTPVKTQMQFVQQFVNMTAGAIHRTVPEALVSTGVWSFKAMTDKNGNTNYYRDDRLIAAGGDPDGVLDFYQIHYYPEHFGNEFSPFHRPADWWGLDKPILVGEFPTSAIEGKTDPHYTTTEAYQLAFEYGYAGAMSWDFRGFGGGSFETAKEGIGYLAANYPDAITVNEAPELFNHAPQVTGSIPNTNILMGSVTVMENYVRLDTVFSDVEDGTALTYSLHENTNPDLLVPEITAGGVVNIALVDNITGRANITIRAVDSGGASAFTTFAINVRDAGGNLALFMPVVASSVETDASTGFARNPSNHVNDGDFDTRWSSTYQDNQSIYIDLGSPTDISLIKLYWEYAFGKHYEIQISDDANTWETIFTETNSDGGEDVVDIDKVTTRYVKMNGIERGTEYGFSLWEFEIYNQITTSIDDKDSKMIVYPNPIIDDRIHLTVNHEGKISIHVKDLYGNSVKKIDVNGSLHYKLGMQELSSGVYYVEISTESGTLTKKIIKL